jgi:hypothetical protein
MLAYEYGGIYVDAQLDRGLRMGLISQLSSQARVVGTIGRVGSHVIWEKIASTRPTLTTDVPRSIEDITPEWLTGVLCARHRGAAVTGVRAFGGSDGSTSRRCLEVDYNEAGRAAGLPRNLFGKATPKFTSRLICGPVGALANEIGFYTHLRPELTIEAPTAYHAAFDPKSYRSIILFKDIAGQGTTFTNPLIYIDRTNAEDMVGVMAAYHGQFWGDPRLDSWDWLQTSEGFQTGVNELIGFEKRSYIGMDRARKVIPQSVMNMRDRIWSRGLMKSLNMNARKPYTYLHSDVHVGNWYRTAEGRMGLCDWQCTVKGQWAGDFSYALSSALTIDDRRAWESDLLELYLEKLRESGVREVPPFDQAWLEYRQQIFHAFFNWVFTIGQGALQPAMQPDEFSMLNIERFAAAIDDLDSMKSLDQ